MNRDFENWYNWHLTHVGFIPRFNAQEVYDKYYSCTCETCMYRKEHGFPPVKVNNNCSAPIGQEGLEKLCQFLLQ